MKYFPLIWAALWRRKLRTWFTMISIAVAFFLFGTLQGVNATIDGVFSVLSTERLRSTGRINSNPMPLAHWQQIASTPGVSAVTPLIAVVGSYPDSNTLGVVLAVDAQAWFNTIYTDSTVSPRALATMQAMRNGILVGSTIAVKKGWKVGDHVSMRSFTAKQQDAAKPWQFEIVGIYETPRKPDWATNVLANFDYVNEARGNGKNTVDQYITKISEPQTYAKLATAIDELFANSSDQTVTLSEADYVRTLLAQVGNIGFLLNGVVGAVLFTLLFLTANTMALSVHDRIPELATLKTLGFSDILLMTMVLIEVLLLCAVAGGAGLGAAAFLFPKMIGTVGAMMGFEGLHIPLTVYAYGAAIAAAVALVSGLPPALRAMRLNIVAGLASR